LSKYILLINWTEQGAKAVNDSASRWDAAKDMARKSGCTLETIYMTFGQYDLVAVMDAPSDEAAAGLCLKISAGGAIRMTTLKAFAEADYRRITSGV
jgi:uncharacterized protein with GYD domain